jgi:NitT/TauT family transport system substrate-binding protein
MTAITRRRFLRGSAAALALTPSLLARPARAQSAFQFGTAVLGDYGLAAPMTVAAEKGFFKQEGVNVEYVPFKSGPDLLKAVIAGEILVGATGGTDVLVFRERGAPVKMIATHVEGNHFTLNVAPEIKTVGELKGKGIGVTAAGSTTWTFARLLAKQQGWNPDRDIQIVALGGLDAQVAALTRKETAAFIFGDSGAVVEHQGKSRVLMRLDQVTPRWISLISYASEDGIKKNPDAIKKGLRAIFRAIRFMKDDPQATAEMVSKKLGWSPEAVLGAHKITGPLLSHDGTMSVEALAVMQETLLELGVVKKKLPLDEHYTKEFTPVRL